LIKQKTTFVLNPVPLPTITIYILKDHYLKNVKVVRSLYPIDTLIANYVKNKEDISSGAN
jgi:hypothetical protein